MFQEGLSPGTQTQLSLLVTAASTDDRHTKHISTCPDLFFGPSSEGAVDDLGPVHQVRGRLLICFVQTCRRRNSMLRLGES